MDIVELQLKQAEYDQKYWQHNASSLEKIRHITLHMGKLNGKLATYCEAAEHGADAPAEQIKNEVVPDLLFFALQLANQFGIRLDDQYLKRLADNMKRKYNI